jgi:hypothetical protein
MSEFDGDELRAFAALVAMHALIPLYAARELKPSGTRVVADAVEFADALLAQLRKPKEAP